MRTAIVAPAALAVVGIAVGCAQIAIAPRHAAFAYASAFFFAVTIAVGALLFVMIATTARAKWFVVFRRTTGAIAAVMPLFLVGFIPIALSLPTLYPWARPAGAFGDPELRHMLEHQHVWMNAPLFLVRSYVYLGLWTLLAFLLRRDSIGNDEAPSEERVRRERFVSAAGLPVMALTLTFASFDWLMPLSPQWTSDMFGMYLFAGCFGGAVGAACVTAWLAWREGMLTAEVRADHFHALGRVLLVGVIFWGYIGFAQFLLVWIADLPREVRFYQDRIEGDWYGVSGALFFARFLAPFLLLLSRPLKRRPATLALVGGALACAHALDVYWIVVPPAGDGPRWLDLGWLIGVPALCAAVGAWRFLGARPLPIHDPALGEALRYESP